MLHFKGTIGFMQNKKDVRFFPVFFAATVGVLLEIVAVLVDEIVVGSIFNDEAFASVNLIEPYTFFEMFIAYLVSVGGASLIVRAHGAGDQKKMSEIFSQTMIMCGLVGIGLTLIYVIFTPQLVKFVADDPSVYQNSLDYFRTLRFYPLVDMFDTFLFTYVLYRGGFSHFYAGIFSRIGLNAILSWYLGSQIGLAGIGLASVISLLVALIIKLTFLFTKKHGLKFRWYLDAREAFKIAKLGFPESAHSLFIVLMETVVNAFTLENYAAAGVAAVAVVINVFEFTLYLGEGVSEYETVAVNDSIGKNSSSSMDRAIRITKRAAVIEGAVLIGLILLGSGVLPEAFDIDNPETAQHATTMLLIIAPTALFLSLSRVTAIFYQYTRRITRTIILFGMTIVFLPSLFGILLGQISIEWIAVGMALGPAAAIGLMYLFVRVIKNQKLFDYRIMNLE